MRLPTYRLAGLLLALCFSASAWAQSQLPAASQPQVTTQAPSSKPTNHSKPANAQHISAETRACMQLMLEHASASTTLGELRHSCQLQQLSMQERSERALRTRLALEHATELNPFVITPHHRNYIMPLSYWSNPTDHDGDPSSNSYRHLESKFQISLKFPLADLWSDATLYGAFTGTFFWQVYSRDISSPFRETNYTPELFITQPLHWHFGEVSGQLLSYGIVHQSNGQNIPLSRSWNRLFAQLVFATGSWYWSLKPWWRIPENKKKNPTDTQGDDNPDILDYMGYSELTASRAFGNQVVEVMLRNNFSSHDNTGAVRINYTFPLSERFKGIVQVFTGYGDSLINYNDYENRISFGILLTDTL